MRTDHIFNKLHFSVCKQLLSVWPRMAILSWKQLLSVMHLIMIKCMPRMAGQDGNGYQLRTPGRTFNLH